MVKWLGVDMISLYNNKHIISDNQGIYDSFNNFIFSEDRNVFNKLYTRMKFYEMTKHLVGDIVECGVFKGSGIFSWLKMIDLEDPNSIKKVIGFDFFDPAFVDDLDKDVDKKTMKQVFDRVQGLNNDDLSYDGISCKIKEAGFKDDKFELVKGDVCETSANFVKDRPGFRISVLYLDMDLEEPTYHALKNFWPNVVPGGIVVFDEYGYHSWSESNGVDKFINEIGISLYKTNVKAPTGYIIK
jgi:hypothetical protein